MAPLALSLTLPPPDDTASLIADTGHPDFPGWELIAVLLMAATISVLLSGDPTTLRRRTGDNRAVRTTIAAQTNAVRFLPRWAA